MKPLRGFLYTLSFESEPDLVPSPEAELVVVLSEDPWNQIMGDSVIVPIYHSDEPPNTVIQPSFDDSRYADTTRIQTVDQGFLGDLVGQCPREVLAAIGAGVRAYFDLDGLTNKTIRRPPSIGRPTFWPHQRDVYWGTRYGEQRERYAVVSEDEFNIRAERCTTMFLTSRDKAWRTRWQVPRAAGFVIAGDIIPFQHAELDSRSRPTPQTLTRDEMAEVAVAVIETLELS